MNQALHRFTRLPVLPAGVLIYAGERALAAHPVGPYLTALGLLLLAACPAALWWTRRGGERGALALEALPLALFLLAALLYLAGLALPAGVREGALHWLLTWGWALSLLLGAFPFLFVELSLWSQGHPERPGRARLSRAVEAGLLLGLLLCLIVTLNFAFHRLGWQWDLAYFKTARPSAATLEVAEGLEETVEVALFYPEDHLVLSLLQAYFNDLAAAPGRLDIRTYDAELHPAQARAFKVRRNGVVLLRKGEVRKSIQVGTLLSQARTRIRNFDGAFFAALLEVARERRTAYITVGHGERNERKPNRDDPRSGISALRSLLAERNFQVKFLGASEGLAADLPRDAALVIVLAPTEAFLPGEVAALRVYLEAGGSLLVLLDPESGAGNVSAARPGAASLEGLLAGYGLKFRPVVQANDRFYARRTFTQADRGLLVTIGYQSHPSVAALSRNARQNPLLLLGSGAWEKGKPPPHLRVQETIRAMEGTWGDGNGNFAFDKGRESRAQPIVSLAVSPALPRGKQPGVKPPRGPHILAFADADFALDFLMRNRANRLVVAEAIRWLAGGLPPGLTGKEKDVQIVHARGDEWVWFYLPVFGMPLLVLGLGYLFSGRPGLRRRV